MNPCLGADLKLHVTALKLVGLWEPSVVSPILRILYRFYAWFCIVIVGFNAVSDLVYLFINDIDLPIISESVITIGSFVKGFLLSFRFATTKEKFYKLVDMMNQLKLNRKHMNDWEDDILHRADREAKIITAAVFIPHFILVAFMNFIPLVLNSKIDYSTNSTEPLHLQYKGWFPFDTTHGFKYVIAFLSQSIAMWIVYIYVSVFETVSVAIMIHISAELNIIYNNFASMRDTNGNDLQIERKLDSQSESNTSQSNIFLGRNLQTSETDKEDGLTHNSVSKTENPNTNNNPQNNTVTAEAVDINPDNGTDNFTGKLSKDGSDKNKTKVSDDEHFDRLIQYVTHHQNVLNFGREANEVLSMILFLQFTVIICALCVSTFVASLPSVESHIRAKSINYAAVLTTQLLLPCWYGQRVIDQSERIKYALYGCGWYEMSSRVKKALTFIIMRAQRPISFSVGGFSIASRETWLSLINFTYSMLAILRQMNEE